MIVKCDKCQTRFKIPDEKVTEKGVKVRCTKCQNTFRVKKGGADAPAAEAPKRDAAPAEPPDPFAQFGSLDDKPRAPAPIPEAPRPATPRFAGAQVDVLGLVARTPEEPDPAAFLFDAPPRPAAPAAPIEAVPTRPDRRVAAKAASAPARAQTSPPRAAPVKAPPPPGLLADVPPLDEGRASTAWIGTNGLEEAAPPTREVLQMPSEPDRAMFDMPAPPPPPAAAPRPLGDGPPPATLGRIKLVQQPAGHSGSHPVQNAAAVEEPGEAAPPRSHARGLVLNLGFAAALLLALVTICAVYLNEGKLDLANFSPGQLKTLLSRSPEVVTLDISNGLYDTRAGRAVFFVRGEVENRGARGRKVKVRAEILDGELLVRAAEGWAGAPPNPEDLYSLGSKEELEKMNERLEKKAQDVASKGRAPFVIAFHEYPPALSGLRLKVTVVDGATRTTAAR